MKFSVTIAQGIDGWKIAKRAEELGFHAAWFEDSQMVSADPVVVMAVAAVNTSRIKLGTGVLIPSNRIAPQTANSFASGPAWLHNILEMEAHGTLGSDLGADKAIPDKYRRVLSRLRAWRRPLSFAASGPRAFPAR